jgi:trans-aconitate 2-methyltransferase
MKGTALRPILSVLSAAHAHAFETALEGRIEGAHAQGPQGVVFPFRRLFFVARAPRVA